MKYIMACGAVIFIVFSIASCGKISIVNPAGTASVAGKWNLVTDSGFTGVGAGHHC
ncbi:MAG: hypothetical protein ABJB86_03735 [Bacteroidota bacterium]